MASSSSSRQVLMLMDFQNFAVNLIPSRETLLANTQKVLNEARVKSIPVIHITFDLKPDFPSKKNKAIQNFKTLFADKMNDPSFWAIHDSLKPLSTELVIPRMRASAFTGVLLDAALREYDADTLVLCGIATSGVVLGTARDASDRDFSVKILHDCCEDLDAEVHRTLMDKLFPFFAHVTSSIDYLSSL